MIKFLPPENPITGKVYLNSQRFLGDRQTFVCPSGLYLEDKQLKFTFETTNFFYDFGSHYMMENNPSSIANFFMQTVISKGIPLIFVSFLLTVLGNDGDRSFQAHCYFEAPTPRYIEATNTDLIIIGMMD